MPRVALKGGMGKVERTMTAKGMTLALASPAGGNRVA